MFKLGGVDTSPTYLLFQTLLPLFWTPTCMIWMKLTRTDVVFAKLPWCCFTCRKQKFLECPENPRRHFLENIKNTRERIKTRGPTPCLGGWGRVLPLGAPTCLVGPPRLRRPQLQLHIFRLTEKKSERKFHRALRYRASAKPYLSREGWSGVRSGLRGGGFVAVVIINHPPSPISWCAPPWVSNSIIGLLDGDGLDEIYHVIKLVLLGFDP